MIENGNNFMTGNENNFMMRSERNSISRIIDKYITAVLLEIKEVNFDDIAKDIIKNNRDRYGISIDGTMAAYDSINGHDTYWWHYNGKDIFSWNNYDDLVSIIRYDKKDSKIHIRTISSPKLEELSDCYSHRTTITTRWFSGRTISINMMDNVRDRDKDFMEYCNNDDINTSMLSKMFKKAGNLHVLEVIDSHISTTLVGIKNPNFDDNEKSIIEKYKDIYYIDSRRGIAKYADNIHICWWYYDKNTEEVILYEPMDSLAFITVSKYDKKDLSIATKIISKEAYTKLPVERLKYFNNIIEMIQLWNYFPSIKIEKTVKEKCSTGDDIQLHVNERIHQVHALNVIDTFISISLSGIDDLHFTKTDKDIIENYKDAYYIDTDNNMALYINNGDKYWWLYNEDTEEVISWNSADTLIYSISKYGIDICINTAYKTIHRDNTILKIDKSLSKVMKKIYNIVSLSIRSTHKEIKLRTNDPTKSKNSGKTQFTHRDGDTSQIAFEYNVPITDITDTVLCTRIYHHIYDKDENGVYSATYDIYPDGEINTSVWLDFRA